MRESLLGRSRHRVRGGVHCVKRALWSCRDQISAFARFVFGGDERELHFLRDRSRKKPTNGVGLPSRRFHQFLSRCSVFPSQERKNNRSPATFADGLSCRLAHIGAASRHSLDRRLKGRCKGRGGFSHVSLALPSRSTLARLGAARLLLR